MWLYKEANPCKTSHSAICIFRLDCKKYTKKNSENVFDLYIPICINNSVCVCVFMSEREKEVQLSFYREGCKNKNFYLTLYFFLKISAVQSAGSVEYTNCISAEV